MTRAKKITAGIAAGLLAGGAYLVTPPAPPAPETYATRRWIARGSNGVAIPGVATVLSVSTNLRDWQRIAANITGSVTVATDSPANFFKVQAL